MHLRILQDLQIQQQKLKDNYLFHFHELSKFTRTKENFNSFVKNTNSTQLLLLTIICKVEDSRGKFHPA